MEIVYLLVGIIAGAAAGWFFALYKNAGRVHQSEHEARLNELVQLNNEKIRINEALLLAQHTLEDNKNILDSLRRNELLLTAENSQLKGHMKNLEEKLTTQREELDNLQTRLKTEFENLANRILEEKSEKFTQQNKTNLDILINPLKEKMDEFRKKVEETHLENTKDRSRLAEQIRNLTELNQGMREDANRLTKALKGESKAQGNWGELVLEKILEKSGLNRGQEYTVQESFVAADGRRQQPDVIVKLPDNKNLIIDSKVSLTAYERISATEDREEQLVQTRLHVKSVRDHIKMLSDKSYQNLYHTGSPDFVLLFIPIESAFATAIHADPELYNDAFDKNIVLVTTSTLLATLRTIANIWKQEYQNRNVLEIAKVGGDLHDKFVNFIEDLVKVGKAMDTAKENYESAMKKLYSGNGNLVKQTEKLKTLGAKAQKQIPPSLLERAE